MNTLISIIIPTINRCDELINAINSISIQLYNEVEIIIVDQNKDDKLLLKLDQLYKNLPIKLYHYLVNFKGASKARNFGVTKANGKYCFFMDDDAEIHKNTLTIGMNYISSNNYDGVFGRCVDRKLRNTVTKFDKNNSFLSIKNYDNKFVESTLLISTELIKKYPFDEELGAGMFYGAEEAHDLVLRLLKDNKVLFYSPEIMIYHPNKVFSYITDNEIKRAYTYRCGLGRLCKKHNLYKIFFKRLFKVIFIILYCTITKNNKLKYYSAEFLGMLCGMILPGMK